MASFEDVRRLALALPETAETTTWGNVAYQVRGKNFVWERPLSKTDLARLGDQAPPPGPIIALRVDDVDAKEAVLAEDPDALFTIEHFKGFAAVLCLLDVIQTDRLDELITDAWLSRAPAKLAKEFLADRP